MNWWIGLLSDSSAWFVRWTAADGSTVMMVAGLTREEALGYPIRWTLEHVKHTNAEARLAEAHKAEIVHAREAELLRALAEVKPLGRPA